MYPVSFEYFAPASVEEALSVLGRFGDEAREGGRDQAAGGGARMKLENSFTVAAPRTQLIAAPTKAAAVTAAQAHPVGSLSLFVGAVRRAVAGLFRRRRK